MLLYLVVFWIVAAIVIFELFTLLKVIALVTLRVVFTVHGAIWIAYAILLVRTGFVEGPRRPCSIQRTCLQFTFLIAKSTCQMPLSVSAR